MHYNFVMDTRVSKCVPPLIELCDGDAAITLDMDVCRGCHAQPSHIILSEAWCGCDEEVWEYDCMDPYALPCGAIDMRPAILGRGRWVPKSKKSVTYPFSYLDKHGRLVFLLDDQLQELKHGRLEGVVLYTINGCQEHGPRFDVEYGPRRDKVYGFGTEAKMPREEC